MGAAEDVSVVLHAMPDNAASAMRAGGRKSLNRAFKAVERHRTPAHSDFEALVVIIAALLASSHALLLHGTHYVLRSHSQSYLRTISLQPPQSEGDEVSCY